MFNLVRGTRLVFLCLAILCGALVTAPAQSNDADADAVADMVSDVLEKLEKDNERARLAMEAELREENKANRFSGPHALFRVAVSLALLLIGGLLVGDALAESMAFLDRFIDAIMQHLRVLSIAGVLIALMDVLLDTVSGRPVWGDGAAQLVLVACSLAALHRARAPGPGSEAESTEDRTTSGANHLVAKAFAKTGEVVARHEKALSVMARRSTALGWAGLVMGVIHLLLAPFPIL